MATGSIFRGINFPFKKNAKSLPAAATDAELVKQSLEQIVLTGRNERVMRPNFGCDATSFVFENNDEILAELIRTSVSAAVGRFEPRVLLQEVQVLRDVEKGDVLVTLVYVLLATRKLDSVQIRFPV